MCVRGCVCVSVCVALFRSLVALLFSLVSLVHWLVTMKRSQHDHVLYDSGRRLRQRSKYSLGSKDEFVELHPTHMPTPQEFEAKQSSATEWLNFDAAHCKICGEKVTRNTFEWTPREQQRFCFLGSARMYRCRTCAEQHHSRNLEFQAEARPHSKKDYCMDCPVELVHPCRMEPPSAVNCSKSQWKNKHNGDRRCFKCARRHAKEVERSVSDRERPETL